MTDASFCPIMATFSTKPEGNTNANQILQFASGPFPERLQQHELLRQGIERIASVLNWIEEVAMKRPIAEGVILVVYKNKQYYICGSAISTSSLAQMRSWLWLKDEPARSTSTRRQRSSRTSTATSDRRRRGLTAPPKLDRMSTMSSWIPKERKEQKPSDTSKRNNSDWF